MAIYLANQGKTYPYECSGSYIWSPKLTKHYVRRAEQMKDKDTNTSHAETVILSNPICRKYISEDITRDNCIMTNYNRSRPAGDS